MRLEGTLDAFSLPDIFQLLSFTKKTGTLHLRRDAAHGAIHLREGLVTGARADISRQELGRRLLGAGLVDDEALASAAEDLADDPALSLARLLAQRAELPTTTATAVAAEQAQDAVFSLLRWPDGEFAFVMDELDRDDLGAAIPVEDVVTEGRRRIVAWAELVESVPAPDAVVRVNPAPPAEPVADRDEWALLSLVDGRRTVADLVTVSGRGEYAVVSALAGLVGRGLLLVGGAADDQLVRRQSLLSALEGRPVEEPSPAAPAPSVPAQAQVVPAQAQVVPAQAQVVPAQAQSVPAQAPGAVFPQRPEPFLPARRPEHAETEVGASMSPTAHAARTSAGSHGSVDGATARQPELSPELSPTIERDPSLNKGLLLRLIAGVRGL